MPTPKTEANKVHLKSPLLNPRPSIFGLYSATPLANFNRGLFLTKQSTGKGIIFDCILRVLNFIAGSNTTTPATPTVQEEKRDLTKKQDKTNNGQNKN